MKSYIKYPWFKSFQNNNYIKNSFPMIIKNNSYSFKRKVLKALTVNNIQFRLITGGCFTEHEYTKHFNYSTYGNLKNAKKAHFYGFFVGNSSIDLKKEIYKLYKTLKDKL